MSKRVTNGKAHLRLLSRAVPGTRDTGSREHVPSSNSVQADSRVRVLVAETEALVRAGYRAMLEADGRITVVGEADTAQQAVELATDTSPDVVLFDLGLAGLDDLTTTAETVSDPAFAKAAVMLMVGDQSEERVLSALLAGAVAVLHKDAGPSELVRAVQVIARGEALLPAGAMRRLLGELPDHSLLRAGPELLDELTDREREVVALVAKGLSNGEIAALLVVSPKTAKTHVSRAMVKLGARHRAQLVVLAYETGLVLPGSNAPFPNQRFSVVA